MAIAINEQQGVPAPPATERRRLPGTPTSIPDHRPNAAMPELFPTAPGRFQEICEGLRALYLADPRPWLVGFSGGKDSTLVASLVFEAALFPRQGSRAA